MAKTVFTAFSDEPFQDAYFKDFLAVEIEDDSEDDLVAFLRGYAESEDLYAGSFNREDGSIEALLTALRAEPYVAKAEVANFFYPWAE